MNTTPTRFMAYDESSMLRVVDMHNYEKMYFLTTRDLEIVGNRFQSPELLELCK